MENKKIISEIYCPKCGAPAKFDILKQEYLCRYCGGNITTKEAAKEKQGFRKIQAKRISDSIKDFHFSKASCPGCGAEIIFEDKQAISTCPFCDSSMVLTAYLNSADLPEALIPFKISLDEAKKALKVWCDQNKNKKEARLLSSLIDDLKRYYLPYQLIKGPVFLTASRMDSKKDYHCQIYLEDEYISCSKELDNLLLNGMEPYDSNELKALDFGYLAGQKVKIADIKDNTLIERARNESASISMPEVSKVLETEKIKLSANVEDLIIFPVLLPVYYISKLNLLASVNGQSGKVSVRSLKDSHYYFLPWWLKAIIATISISLISFGAIYLFSKNIQTSIYVTALLAFFYLIVTLTYYSDTEKNKFKISSGKKIYTSKINEDNKKTYSPIFFEKIDGETRPVVLRFTTLSRIIKILILTIIALFLPVILALIINGFDFKKLNLSGSLVWFCIAVPVVPIYLLKFGIEELHDRPLIYIYKEDGSLKLYHQKIKIFTKSNIIGILKALFIPPVSLAVWFAIISFFTIVYLTAFGY